MMTHLYVSVPERTITFYLLLRRNAVLTSKMVRYGDKADDVHRWAQRPYRSPKILFTNIRKEKLGHSLLLEHDMARKVLSAILDKASLEEGCQDRLLCDCS